MMAPASTARFFPQRVVADFVAKCLFFIFSTTDTAAGSKSLNGSSATRAAAFFLADNSAASTAGAFTLLVSLPMEVALAGAPTSCGGGKVLPAAGLPPALANCTNAWATATGV